MSPDEFKARQDELRMTNQEIADELQVSLSTVEKWRGGLREIPAPMEKLIGYIRPTKKGDKK